MQGPTAYERFSDNMMKIQFSNRRINRAKILYILLAVTFGAVSLPAEPLLPKIFGDSMVLQRDMAVPVWGVADPGEEVSVKFAGQAKRATADKNGEWQVKLDPMPSSTQARSMEISSPKLTKAILFNNVLVGDVWMCGGQSNMYFSLNATGVPEDISSANFPNIRCIKVNPTATGEPQNDITTYGWHLANPSSAGGFTAAGFFFAREINKITGIPIGLIDDNQGGTQIESWCSRASLSATPELSDISKKYEAKMSEYRQSLPEKMEALEKWIQGARKALAENRDMPKAQWPVNPLAGQGNPCALFNGMIAPLIPYGIKGALWYQGEDNFKDGDIYFHKMKALIGGWRAAWGQGDFPFYFVQLANFGPPQTVAAGGGGFTGVRLAQFKALSIANTGMAVAIDLGEANNIHPKNKLDVGKRLALWALAKNYGQKDIVYSGPLFREQKIENGAIRIYFDSIGSGLMVGKKNGRDPAVEDAGEKLKLFAIAGADKKYVWANAVIDKDSVVVSSASVPRPVSVVYALAGNPEGANLYNKEGLPASPFRSDDAPARLPR